jgi:hypothetical protein
MGMSVKIRVDHMIDSLSLNINNTDMDRLFL